LGDIGNFPSYSAGELIADGFIHLIGVAASISAVTALMVVASIYLPALSIASLGIYGVGLLAVFGFSAGYHMIRIPSWKEVLRHFDRSAIFIMIAGTYTPFAIVKMGGVWGYSLLAIVWAVAIIGIVLQPLLSRRYQWTLTALYLVQGWAVLLAIDPLLSAVSMRVLILLGIGGSLYTLGVVFHLWRSLPYQNAIWHGFVLTAAGFHYSAVLDAIAFAGNLA
jgi:hemolysin III